MLKFKFISFFGMCGLALLPCPKLKAQSGLTQYASILNAGGNDQKVPGTASSTGVWGKTYASDDFSGYLTVDRQFPVYDIIHAKGTLHASANPGHGDYQNGGQSQLSVTYVYVGNYPGETTLYQLSYFLVTGGPPTPPADCGGQLISVLVNNGEPIYQGDGQVRGKLVPNVPYIIDVNVQGNTCANGPNGSGGNLICGAGYQSSYNGSWEFTLLVYGNTDSTVLPQPHVSQIQHQFTAADLWRQSALLAGSALMQQSGGSPQAMLCGALFADASAVANADQQLVQNSADTNFTVIALPVLPSLTSLSSGTNFTPADADAFNIWATNLIEQSVFAQAIGTCFNRAIAASAITNSYWEQQQVNAIYQYEAQFAWYLDAEPALRSNFVAVLEADAFPSTSIDPTNVMAFEQSIASNGLPSVLVSDLTALGADTAAITNIQNSFGGVDPFGAAGTFPQSLMNTNLDSSSHAMAADMRGASLVMINANLLPSGQFRFDVPTEPGYTYSIQLTQNLANPTNWTTLSTVSATTYLLSYTNSPPGGAQAVFYQVTQN